MDARQDGFRNSGGGTLADRAHRLLEERIVTLDLPPGGRVTEQELAAQVGLGRTPVREALQRLIADGLVIVYPRRGLLISDINPIDVLQALETRLALERLQARDAALRAKPDERKKCLAYGREMRMIGCPSSSAADMQHYMSMDRACDAVLADAAGNPFTARALEPLQTMSRRAWWRFCRAVDLAPAAELHADLLDAVADGGAAVAEAGAQALVEHVRDAIRAGVRDDRN